ncbi:Ig-like domain-containing protein [Metabacillus fastidiosus]|uniref:Ig-like domain-containing protein n=1 Tax=Metabacillus fastidiosus TaxID=1458 RepID=UPI002E239A9B|nr:Ig-like domain-containing protein [Metabacillus fastidiosus]
MKKALKVIPVAAAVAVAGSPLIAPTSASAAEVTLGKVDFGGTIGSVDYSTINKLQAFPSHPDYSKYFNTDGSLKSQPTTIELDGVAYDYAKVNRGLSLGQTLEQIKETLTPVPTGLKVESVSAINATSVKVTFNKEVESLAKADVTVLNTKTSEKQYVKEVKLAGDKKSATVELYEALETKNTYNVAVKVGETTTSKDFDFVIGEVAKIEAKTTQVKPAGSIDLDELEYTVLDAAGLDITASTTVKFESTVLPNGSNVINLTDGNTAFVYVVAEKEDGTKVKSQRITVKAEASKAVAITNYSVANTSAGAPDYDADDYKQSVTVQKGDATKSIFAQADDQFGDVFGGTITFESLDKTVALVDKATGAITPLKEGTVPVKITAGTGTNAVTKTVELKVVADAKVTSIETDKAEISVSNSVTSPTQVKVTTRDQYNNEFNGGTASVKVISGSDLVTGVPSTLNLASGTANLSVTGAAGKSGTAVIEIKVNDTIKTTVKVNVVAADAVDAYIVEDFVASLDKNDANDKTESAMTLKAFPVDANGVKTGNAATASYTITDKNGEVVGSEDVNITTSIDAANNANLEAGETYTVTVKVGTIEVFTKEFTVIDTSSKPVVEQTTSSIAADINQDITTDIRDAFKLTFENVAQDNFALVNVTFKSDNVGVVASGTEATTVVTKAVEGTATLAISTITIDLDGVTGAGEEDDQYTINLDSLINVKVVDLEAAALKVLNTALDTPGSATAAQYTAAGITGVTDGESGNLDAVNTAVEAAKATKGSALTQSEIQDEVDALQ